MHHSLSINLGINAHSFIWALIEPSTSIVAACLPTFGPLLKGWRMPQSIVDGVRSVLSSNKPHSGTGSQQYVVSRMSNNKADQGSCTAKRPWMELPSNSAIVEGGPQDLELAALKAGAGIILKERILVERSFATTMGEQK